MKSNLYIQASLRAGITYPTQIYYTPPFKVANITENKQATCLELMLMCSSPGILDDDDYTLKIDIDEGASLQLYTQSYQRIFDMKRGASQRMEVTLKNGASFIWLPHPSVPHKNSIFSANNKIHLSNDCTLFWGEVITCGRMLNNEFFSFKKYHSITEVYNGHVLVLKENILLQPSIVQENAMGKWEGYTHQASLICLSSNFDARAKADSVHDYLSAMNDIEFGVTMTAVNGIEVRMLGFKAEKLYNCIKSIAKMISS